MKKFLKTGIPDESGVYVVYIKHPVAGDDFPFPDKQLAMFMADGGWTHLGSDQKYREEILAFLGPIPAPKIEDIRRIGKKHAYAIGKQDDRGSYGFTNGPFDTLKEARREIGYEGEFILKIAVGLPPKKLGYWSEEDCKWLKYEERQKKYR